MTKKNIKIIDDVVITNNDNIQLLADINNGIDNGVNQHVLKKNMSVCTNEKIIVNNYDNLDIRKEISNLNISENLKFTNQINDNHVVHMYEQNDIVTNQTTNINEHIKVPKKSNDFFKELLLKQLPNINSTKKLTYSDIKRISKFLITSIFDENNCSIWNGYITNEKNQTKGTYINFYFNQKKIALHRLLYLNFIGDILNTEYIKFSCTNKGKCCNIHHMKKYLYNSNFIPVNTEEPHGDNSVHIVQNKKNLVIEL